MSLSIDMLDSIERAATAAAGSAMRIECRRDARSAGDIALFCRGDAGSVCQAVAALDGVESVRRAGDRLSIRLDERTLAAAGRAMAGGAFPAGVATAPDRPAMVGFLGANLCKALHIGHLRNIVLGHATAALLAAGGRRVRSYSLVGDIGRNVCEAMAGWEAAPPADRACPAERKPDAHVGRLYQAYVARAGMMPGPHADPCWREALAADDPADRMIARWRAGEPAARALWARICDLVDGGHRETLGRLGIAIDERWRESEHLALASTILARGLARGLFVREAGGMVVYATGRQEYPRIVLARSDGFPCEPLRVIAVFHRLLDRTGGCEHIDWNGAEWEPAQRVMAALLDKLGLRPAASRHRPMIHGMVRIEGEDLGSSRGDPLLIDALLDRVRDAPPIAARVADPAAREAVAALLLKCFFLAAPVGRPLAFSWQRLMTPASNPGWTIVDAWLRARRAATADDGAPAIDGDYRTAVVQALGIGRTIAQATRDLRLSGAFALLTAACERYLRAPRSARHDQLADSTINHMLSALGLLPFR